MKMNTVEKVTEITKTKLEELKERKRQRFIVYFLVCNLAVKRRHEGSHKCRSLGEDVPTRATVPGVSYLVRLVTINRLLATINLHTKIGLLNCITTHRQMREAS